MAEEQVIAPTTEIAPRRGPGLMTLVKGVAFVSVIVILEVAAATMFIPSAEETRAIGVELVKGAHAETETSSSDAHGDHGGGSEEAGHGAPTLEKHLGLYHVVSFNPTTQTSLNIDFELFGIVLAADEKEFQHMLELHEKRMNEQVTIAIRGMEAADFTDPGLGLIKRIILEKTNRALGKPLVREAVFSEFSFMER